jgi:hypothetical protein
MNSPRETSTPAHLIAEMLCPHRLSPVPSRQLVATGGSVFPRRSRMSAVSPWDPRGELAPFEISPSDGVFSDLT